MPLPPAEATEATEPALPALPDAGVLPALQAVHEHSRARRIVAGLWRRCSLRRGLQDQAGVNRLYAMPDPWGMATAREQSRFVQTNAVIRQCMGPARIGTLLELGSGEGHQSQHLAALCGQLYGLDVSDRAVARARMRLPGAQFAVGELAALPWAAPPGGRYGLVTACEVLYFFADVPATLQRMSALGDACLVTFFAPAARRVAEPLAALPGVQHGWFCHGQQAWLWAFWRPA